MSTRSTTLFVDHKGRRVAAFYRHCGGYPSGAGKEMQEVIKGGTLVNGITFEGKEFNGMGDLAFRVIASLKKKDEPGNLYMINPDDGGVGEQEYAYTVYPIDETGKGKIGFKVQNGEDVLFNGDVEEFDAAAVCDF